MASGLVERNEDTLRLARDLIASRPHVLLLVHERPDGDALGSLLGLAWMLRAAGHEVTAVSRDGVPPGFRFLPGSETVENGLPGQADLCILLDCSDLERVGDIARGVPLAPDINIDHHTTNTRFARINLVDPSAVATSQVLCDLQEPLRLPLGLEAATCLLTGVVSDTLGFRTSNVNLRTLQTAEGLITAGADLPALVEASLYRRSFAAARYWGAGLSHLERDDHMVWTALSLGDRRAAEYPGRDDADLINVLSTLEGTRLALIFVEQEGGTVKVSWRARNGLDVTPLAGAFGGGGHPAAAGATVAGSLQDVTHRVVETTREWLRGKV